MFDGNFLQIQNEFTDKSPNFILSSNPFLKTEFLNKLIEYVNIPVIFLDFDLLYSGYMNSGIIRKNKKLNIYVSSKISLNDDIKDIVKKIETKQSLVILDSLNGLYNMFNELENVRFINAAIMLLSSVAEYSKSQIVVTAMTRKNENDEYILSPTGRHLVQLKNVGFFELGLTEISLVLNLIDKNHKIQKSYEIKR